MVEKIRNESSTATPIAFNDLGSIQDFDQEIVLYIGRKIFVFTKDFSIEAVDLIKDIAKAVQDIIVLSIKSFKEGRSQEFDPLVVTPFIPTVKEGITKPLFKHRRVYNLRSQAKRQNGAEKTARIGFGIQNCGNSCYMAAVLQSLKAIPIVQKNLNDPKSNQSPIAQEVKKIFKKLEAGTLRSDEIQSFRRFCMNYGWNPKSEYTQEDGAELTQFLVDQLGYPVTSFYILKEHPNFPFTSSLLDGQYDTDNHLNLPLVHVHETTTLKQLGGRAPIVETVNKHDIKLPRRVSKHIREKLKKLPKEIPVDTHQTATLSSSQVPDLLPIALKKFGYDKKTGLEFKINKKVIPSKEYIIPFNDQPGKAARYILRSFLTHEGDTSHSGHYRAIVPSKSADGTEYIEYNDAQVSKLSSDAPAIKEGYVFFYEFDSVVSL